MRFRLVVDGKEHEVAVSHEGATFRVAVNGRTFKAAADIGTKGTRVAIGRATHDIVFRRGQVSIDGAPVSAAVLPPKPRANASSRVDAAAGRWVEVRPPMPGRIVRVAVRPGQRVGVGDAVAVLEAMKMQNELPSPVEGIVRRVPTREGTVVTVEQVLVVIEPR